MSYQHLTYEERHTISTLRRNGSKPSHIAQQLGRHVSTINRELRRNATLEGGYQYRYAPRRHSNVPFKLIAGQRDALPSRGPSW